MAKDISSQFPTLKQTVNGRRLVYFDNGASSQKPQRVLDALDKYYSEINSNIHRGVHHLSQKATDAFEQSRDCVKEFINAQHREEIIFTSGTTESINIVANAFRKAKLVKPGAEILISAFEHHSNIVPWQMLCEECDAKLVVVPMNDRGEISLEHFKQCINQKTAIVAISHISNALGSINPIKKFIDSAHAMGVPVLIDGAQAVPHQIVDVEALDADFYCFSAHKMYGPTGVGVLFGKKSWLEKLPPVNGGGEMIATVSFDKTTYAALPHKFEAGTPNIAGVVATKAAIEFMWDCGIQNIGAKEQELLEYATEQLQKIPDLKIYGNSQQKASLISFNVEGIHPYDLGTLLDQMGIAVRTGHHCAQPVMDYFGIPGTVRASFAVYNTLEEVDLFIEALQKALNMLK